MVKEAFGSFNTIQIVILKVSKVKQFVRDVPLQRYYMLHIYIFVCINRSNIIIM